MGEVKEIKLHGSRLSSFCAMVHHALRLKGVVYEYVEEDLHNKSQVLLELNPVDKKVPVLVVDGKPIAESLVILQYIDEMWKEPSFLPEDPYMRAVVRFWADFFCQKILSATFAILGSEGEAKEKAAKEYMEHMSTLENGIAKDLSSGETFIHGERPGLLDAIVSSCYSGLKSLEEVVDMELLSKERTPHLCSFIAEFLDLELTKDTMAPHETLVECVGALRKVNYD